MIKLQNETAGPDVMRVPGGRPAANSLGALGFVTTAISIVLACVPAEDDPNKTLAVAKVVGMPRSTGVGAGLFALGNRRARMFAMRHARTLPGSPVCCALAVHRRRCEWTTTTPGTRPGAIQPGSHRGRTAAVARQSATPMDGHNRGKYFFEVVDRDRDGRSTRADSARSTASGRRPPKRNRRTGRFLSRCAFPVVDKPVRIVLKKRDARNKFRTSGPTVDPADKFIEPGRAAGECGAADQAARARRSGRQARSADSWRRLHGGGARQVRAGRTAVHRAFSSPRRRSRNASARSTCGDLSPPSPIQEFRRPSEHCHKRTPLGTTLRHVRHGAVRADRRESRLSRHRRQCALRRGRNSGRTARIRRRRHLRPLQHGRRGQPVGAVHLRP